MKKVYLMLLQKRMILTPLYIEVPRVRKPNKKILLGMNWYRNAHWIELNNVKDLYTKLMLPVIPDIQLKVPIQVVFKYWLKNKSQDLNNIHSVITKFFFDALVKK